MLDAAVLATVALLVGLVLLGLEFFIPSFGMILVLAVISLVVSFWAACKAWWGSDPMFFWSYVCFFLAGIPASLLGAIAILQKTSLGSRMTLPPAPSAETLPPNPLEELIGQMGTSVTLMTPGGIVLIDGERHHAESVGMLIEPGTPIQVVGVKANRVVVSPVSATVSNSEKAASDIPAEIPSERSTTRTDQGGALDFDIPEQYTQDR